MGTCLSAIHIPSHWRLFFLSWLQHLNAIKSIYSLKCDRFSVKDVHNPTQRWPWHSSSFFAMSDCLFVDLFCVLQKSKRFAKLCLHFLFFDRLSLHASLSQEKLVGEIGAISWPVQFCFTCCKWRNILMAHLEYSSFISKQHCDLQTDCAPFASVARFTEHLKKCTSRARWSLPVPSLLALLLPLTTACNGHGRVRWPLFSLSLSHCASLQWWL